MCQTLQSAALALYNSLSLVQFLAQFFTKESHHPRHDARMVHFASDRAFCEQPVRAQAAIGCITVLLLLSTASSDEKPRKALRALPPVEAGLSKTLVEQLNLLHDKTFLFGSTVSLITDHEELLWTRRTLCRIACHTVRQAPSVLHLKTFASAQNSCFDAVQAC